MAVTNTVGGGVPAAPEKKRQQEKATVGLMIELYCRGHHGTPKGRLCPDCAVLRDYADARVDHCPHIATKTFCSVCQTHCYKPEMRERIRQVMRWSGPRMLFHHPVLAVRHLAETRAGHAPPLQTGPKAGGYPIICRSSFPSQFVQSCTIYVSNNYLLFTNLFG